jgi:hypothetical protein
MLGNSELAAGLKNTPPAASPNSHRRDGDQVLVDQGQQPGQGMCQRSAAIMTRTGGAVDDGAGDWAFSSSTGRSRQ